MNLSIFVIIHNLMKHINAIDSCQAHLQVQYSFARSDTVVLIDSEPHMICICKTSLVCFIACAHSDIGFSTVLHSKQIYFAPDLLM